MKRGVTKAIILVGGWGTRLRPLTYTTPKPLVPFCNRPMLKYQIEKLVKAGVREIVLAINYYSDIIIKECAMYEEEFGIRIIYSKEDSPLGTGGPIALAHKYLKGNSFFVLNSDICCNSDLEKMVHAYMSTDCLAMVMTYPVEDPTRYGLVRIEDGMIKSFIEKPKYKEEHPQPWIINAGIYIFSEEVLKYVEVKEMALETAVFPKLAENNQLAQFAHTGYWMDIGQIKDYLDGQRIYLNDMLGNDNGIGLLDSNSGPSDWSSSQTENSTESVEYSSPYMCRDKNVVIGRNVVIGKNVVLKNCTIFDGTKIGDNSTVVNSVIGWDCVIGDKCLVEDISALGKGVFIDNGLNIKSQKVMPMESIFAAGK